MLLKRPRLAIDIGTSSVKLVEISGTDAKKRLTKVGLELLPRGAVIEGEIKDPKSVTDTIKALIDKLQIKTNRRRVSLSVAGNTVIIKRILVNLEKDADEGEQLYEEAKQHFHHDLEDMYFRYQMIDSNFLVGDSQAAVIVASKIEIIEQYLEMIHELGMKVGLIDCDVFCLSNMFSFSYPIADSLIALINIGASSTQIVLTYNGEFLFNREVFIGGNQFTLKIAESLGVEFENAESIKLSASGGDGTLIEQIRPFMTDTIDFLTSEIKATIDFFLQAEEFPDEIKKLSYIYLCGGAANTLDLAQSISTSMKVPVQMINPFQRIDTSGVADDMETLLSQGALYGVGVGLGLRSDD